jgi:hypothetical protein
MSVAHGEHLQSALEIVDALALTCNPTVVGSQSPATSDTDAQSSSSIDEQIGALLNDRDRLLELLRDGDAHIEALTKAHEQTKAAKEEVQRLRQYLSYVDQHQEDEQSGACLPLHAGEVHESPFVELITKVPLLRAQAAEIEDLRKLSSKTAWRAEERSRLGEVVMRHSKRSVALLAYSRQHIEDLDEYLAAYSQADLLRASLPNANNGDDGLDWTLIAEDVGARHSAEECRTQWLMIERPDLRTCEWQDSELARLREVLRAVDEDGDWNLVASRMANGRTAFDCFVACQRHDLNEKYCTTKPHAWARVPFSAREAQEFDRLHRTWGNRAVIIEERLGTSRPKKHITSRMAASNTSVRWSARADNALIRYLSTESHLRRSNLLREPERLGTIDWSARFLGRPKNASPDDVKGRWRYLVEDFETYPERYLQDARKGHDKSS